MSLKAKLEAIIYAAETPITLDHIFQLVKESVISDGAPDEAEAKSVVRATLEDLVADYSTTDHGVEIRQVAGGYRMSTKPEHHDVVRIFAKSLKPPIRLSLPALETLAVIAYKQPVTVPEISEIRGVDSSGVIGTLLDRKLITTAGRKAVVGRPILYRSTKEFLLRFGLKDVSELPSMEEFEKLVAESFQSDLLPVDDQTADSTPAEDSVPPDSSLGEGAEQEADLQSVEAAEDEGMATAEQRDRGENDPAA
ncbi:MAG: SMC-Scp complex subunit ScpB [Acidobacteriales bacterium 13_2_20CM_55_8]|jgi:segregation and condensation protein B|nr:MAG: SMC-Scp complex subunit ScpB [Acidobacteriales bacterium 13_2_20CM_55_8]